MRPDDPSQFDTDLSFSGRALLLLFSPVDVEPLVKHPWTKRLSFQLS